MQYPPTLRGRHVGRHTGRRPRLCAHHRRFCRGYFLAMVCYTSASRGVQVRMAVEHNAVKSSLAQPGVRQP